MESQENYGEVGNNDGADETSMEFTNLLHSAVGQPDVAHPPFLEEDSKPFSHSKADDIRRFLRDSNEAIVVMNWHCRLFMAGGTAVWLLLVSVAYICAYSTGSFYRLQGLERFPPGTASGIFFLSWASLFLPRVIREGPGALISSSVIVSASLILLISCINEAIIAHASLPLLIDGVLGLRVQTIRWAAWTPLTAVIIFFTEAFEIAGSRSTASRRRAVWDAYYLALSLGCATGLGLVWPFFSHRWLWLPTFGTAFVLYCQIYVRWHSKRKSFLTMRQGTTADDLEMHLISKFSLRMLTVCVVMWTSFVLLWCYVALAAVLTPRDSPLRVSWLPEAYDSAMDVVAKVIFVSGLIEVHDNIVDGNARARRRLMELKELMNAVLEKSSDVICFSRRNTATGDVMTMVSPAVVILLDKKERDEEKLLGFARAGNAANANFDDGDSDDSSNILIFRLSKEDVERCNRRNRFSQEDHQSSLLAGSSDGGSESKLRRRRTNQSSTGRVGLVREAMGGESTEGVIIDRRLKPQVLWNVNINEFRDQFFLRLDSGPSILTPGEMPEGAVPSGDQTLSLATLACRVWNAPGPESVFPHDLLGPKQQPLRCEVKVSRIDEDSVVYVIRDLSETLRRLEAERTARQKDAEANRFTKHEVKNGLLAAIGLCESLQVAVDGISRQWPTDAFPDGNVEISAHGVAMPATPLVSSSSTGDLEQPENLSREDTLPEMRRSFTAVSTCSFELNSALRNILETVLAESMARDLINENYNPKLECVDVPKLLLATSKSLLDREDRFPLLCMPEDFPALELDPDLIRCIHRNAISNACKYGMKGGEIKTELRYDSGHQFFTMLVINLPGERHEELLEMGQSARDAVFAPRSRVHARMRTGVAASSSSQSTRTAQDAQDIARTSAGDGAWIMSKCAKTLGGSCEIEFLTDRTVFTLRCPARRIDPLSTRTMNEDPSTFELPRNVRAIVIDDCKIQRKILARFLSLLGVPDDRCFVLGGSWKEIIGFEDHAFDCIHRYSEDYFLVIADENLDHPDPDMALSGLDRVSGSLCLANLRRRLLPHEERRLLALVRSANDSVQDVAIYNSRAHGYLSKGPISKEKIMAQLAPIWRRRFPSYCATDAG